MPVIRLIPARHGVVVAYGVSGSGKTYSVNDYVKRWYQSLANSFASQNDGTKTLRLALGAVELRMSDRADNSDKTGRNVVKKGEGIVDLLAPGQYLLH